MEIRKTEKKEGIATQIAKKEELTPNERKEELLRAGLDFHKIPEVPVLVVTWVIWGILCLLPTIAEVSHLEFLGFALELYMRVLKKSASVAISQL
jgi:hypothetical protein